MTSSQQGAGHDVAVSPAVKLWLLISLTSTPAFASKSSKNLKEEGGI